MLSTSRNDRLALLLLEPHTSTKVIFYSWATCCYFISTVAPLTMDEKTSDAREHAGRSIIEKVNFGRWWSRDIFLLARRVEEKNKRIQPTDAHHYLSIQFHLVSAVRFRSVSLLHKSLIYLTPSQLFTHT